VGALYLGRKKGQDKSLNQSSHIEDNA